MQETVSQLEKRIVELEIKLEDQRMESDTKQLAEVKYQEASLNAVNKINEREIRKNNFIVFSLNESDGGSNSDKATVQKIIKHVCPEINTSNIKTFRIGRQQLK
nr:unnamed protein product [Callosobruchus analis]